MFPVYNTDPSGLIQILEGVFPLLKWLIDWGRERNITSVNYKYANNLDGHLIGRVVGFSVSWSTLYLIIKCEPIIDLDADQQNIR